jgi:predicted transposase YdaD
MSSTKDKNERILESIRLAKQIKNNRNLMNSLALLYAFAEKFVDENNMDKIKEVFGMTELGRLLREEGKKEGKEEGIKEGRKEGKKEGRRQELIRTSTRLLTKKFGILPDNIKGKIENSDTTVLEIIVDEILDFKKLEDTYKYLK